MEDALFLWGKLSFLPFIGIGVFSTQALPHDGESIMVAPWPQADAALDFSADESDFEMIMQVIRAIRARRGEMNVPPSKKTRLFIMTAHKAVFEQGRPFFARLAFASGVELGDRF